MIIIAFLVITLFYALGGAKGYSRAFRWLLIPLALILFNHNILWAFLSIPLSIGYGETSTLRTLVKEIFKDNDNLITRLIISLLIALTVLFINKSFLVLLFIPYYVAFTAFWKFDDSMIWVLNVEELFIGLGLSFITLLV